MKRVLWVVTVFLLSLPSPPIMAEPLNYERIVTRISAKLYAHQLVKTPTQWACLLKLWEHESHWRETARNKISGAFGIPQALPGRKMASAGRDWAVNPFTQVRWGVHYLDGRYGSACGAWDFWQRHGWY